MSSADPAQSSSRGIFAEVVRLQKAGRTCVLAVPLWSRGSVPLRHHSKLLYRDDGTIQGTIGGGLLEAEVLAAAPQVMSQGDCFRQILVEVQGPGYGTGYLRNLQSMGEPGHIVIT